MNSTNNFCVNINATTNTGKPFISDRFSFIDEKSHEPIKTAYLTAERYFKNELNEWMDLIRLNVYKSVEITLFNNHCEIIQSIKISN